MLINAGLQEWAAASFSVWEPWLPVQPMGLDQPGTMMEPEQKNVLFVSIAPTSSAVARVIGLKVEPGS